MISDTALSFVELQRTSLLLRSRSNQQFTKSAQRDVANFTHGKSLVKAGDADRRNYVCQDVLIKANNERSLPRINGKVENRGDSWYELINGGVPIKSGLNLME